jgi:hypothetical protein
VHTARGVNHLCVAVLCVVEGGGEAEGQGNKRGLGVCGTELREEAINTKAVHYPITNCMKWAPPPACGRPVCGGVCGGQGRGQGNKRN